MIIYINYWRNARCILIIIRHILIVKIRSALLSQHIRSLGIICVTHWERSDSVGVGANPNFSLGRYNKKESLLEPIEESSARMIRCQRVTGTRHIANYISIFGIASKTGSDSWYREHAIYLIFLCVLFISVMFLLSISIYLSIYSYHVSSFFWEMNWKIRWLHQ